VVAAPPPIPCPLRLTTPRGPGSLALLSRARSTYKELLLDVGWPRQAGHPPPPGGQLRPGALGALLATWEGGIADARVDSQQSERAIGGGPPPGLAVRFAGTTLAASTQPSSRPQVTTVVLLLKIQSQKETGLFVGLLSFARPESVGLFTCLLSAFHDDRPRAELRHPRTVRPAGRAQTCQGTPGADSSL
jgi:hypothetical protein